MFEIKNLRKQYLSNKSQVPSCALNGLNVSFGDSGFVCIIGKSGSGKTTFLNILGGIETKFDGQVIYNGEDVATFNTNRLNDYRNHDVAFVFQEYNLLNEYTVLENVKLAVSFQETDEKVILNNSKKALETVGLGDFCDRKIKTLSGGQQQRVAIARALAKNSKVILCDEPTGNLDSETSSQIIETLKNISNERLVIVVTHDTEIAALADRIINLKDGNIIEDSGKSSQNSDDKIAKSSIKYGGMKLVPSFKMIFDNLRNSIFSSTFITLLLTATFALITVFLSLTKYDSQNSFVETLRKNQQYIVGLSKYVDEPREIYIYGEKTIENGPVIDCYGNKFEDIEKLKSENSQADFYASYFFNKNIQDFSDNLIIPSGKNFQYYAYGFRELVIVEDFSKFNQPLSFGRLPEQDDEVLIYDYMASSLIENGVFQGEISQIAGKTLVDRQTGFSMKISGILKSDYLRYSYIQESKGDYGFEESYLSGLQVVFGKENLIDKLQQEKLIESVFNFYFYNVTTEKQVATDIKKIKRTDLSGINFIACADNFENESGLIISKQTCADILGISVDKVDSEVAKSFLNNYSSYYTSNIFDYSIERSYLLQSEISIGAVSDNLTDQSGMCLYYDSNNSVGLWCNSAFRQIYLSLSEDWDKNVQILDNFIMQQQSEEFYKENPNYRFEGYTDYTPTGIIVHDADYYLKDVRGLADIVLTVLSISAVVGIFLFVFLSIKKYSYKIGILKSLGAKNIDISFVFGLQLLLVVVISLALCVPLAYLLMAFINGKFVNRINSSLVFFFIKPTSFLTVSLISFIVVITSLLIPLIKLALSSPVSIIRNNKNR